MRKVTGNVWRKENEKQIWAGQGSAENKHMNNEFFMLELEKESNHLGLNLVVTKCRDIRSNARESLTADQSGTFPVSGGPNPSLEAPISISRLKSLP